MGIPTARSARNWLDGQTTSLNLFAWPSAQRRTEPICTQGCPWLSGRRRRSDHHDLPALPGQARNCSTSLATLLVMPVAPASRVVGTDVP